ncbi:type II secretion system minor pseudopilin GspH [Ningiella sp. W23]|uniref:type II secretion system minor pseudopilin GspH n=1 Tax=Ningiella sp. W23 TaxID=3023715 RepID=UPI0037572C47
MKQHKWQADHNAQHGFTLLEIILVLAIIGLVVSTVSYNIIGTDPRDEVEQETRKLQVLVDMASDYAVLNQMQLGLRLDDEKVSYEFVHLDENQRWQPIQNQEIFTLRELPEYYSFELFLEDLPWQEDESLFDSTIFDEGLSVSEDSVEIGNEEDIEPPPPQILILSSGEITPFELQLIFEDPFSDDSPFFFSLQGQEVPPLVREGPTDL